MPEVRVYCIQGGRVRRRQFEDRREAWEYALKQQAKGALCFLSG